MFTILYPDIRGVAWCELWHLMKLVFLVIYLATVLVQGFYRRGTNIRYQ